MTVALKAIVFNHGLGAGQRYTLPLCFNERQPVSVPEWIRGSTSASATAYVRDLLPSVASILAQFVASPDEPRGLEICALSSASPLMPNTSQQRLLPNLPPTLVNFTQTGDTGWCVFPLDVSGLASGGVGVSVSQWTWYYRRTPFQAWVPFDLSIHKTYVVLSTPTAPWSVQPASPFNPAWPWTDVLDLVCEWAEGAQDVVQAAGLITKAVNALGPERITYDTFVGAPHYTVLGVNRFLCEAFIERVRGGEGAGHLVNCSDCATIVSTLSNLLGADLWQSKMGLVAPHFALNPILGIGADSWSTLWGSFTFHEVAWSGGCTARDTVYDACLQTDADINPTSAPHTASLPVNQVFGEVGTGDYRDQIAAPADRGVCVPQPRLRVRRSITSQAVPFTPQRSTLTTRKSAEERLRFSDLAATSKTFNLSETSDAPEYFFEGFRFSGGELPGWSLSRLDQTTTLEESAAVPAARSMVFAIDGVMMTEPRHAPSSQVHISWWRSPARPDVLLRIETFDTPSTADAHATLLRISNEVQCPLLEPWESGGVGDVAFKTPDGTFVMFARGNHVHVVRSAAEQPIDVTQESALLDDWLTSAGVPATDSLLPFETRVPVAPGGAPTWTRFMLHRARAQRDPDSLMLAPGRLSGGSVKAFVVEPTQEAARRSMKRPYDR